MVATNKEKSNFIICPICSRGKLICENANISDNRIQAFKPNESKKARWFIKCPVCKGQVGLALNN